MNTAIEQMLKNYQIENIYDQKNAMKEIFLPSHRILQGARNPPP